MPSLNPTLAFSPAVSLAARRRARRMKVCVAGLRGIPGVMGGVETHCEELYPRICRIRPDIDVEVIARRAYTGSDGYSFSGVKVTPLMSLKSKYLEAITGTLVAIFHARFRSKADLLHLHAIGPGLLAPLARMLGLRTIVTHHGRDYQRAKWGPVASAVLSLGERCAFGAADTVLVVSAWLARDLARQYPQYAHKIKVSPNGTPRHHPSEGGRESKSVLDRFGLQPSEYILAVGRLVPEKGLDDLLAAYEQLGDRRKLVIAGAADHQDQYARALMSKAGDGVVFAGRVDRETLDVLYRNAERFVLPSHHEGLPIAALEAGSWAVPMLLSNIPANRDVGLSASHYFPVGDIEALKRKLAEPAANLKVDAEDLARRFDWDVTAANTADTYVSSLAFA